MRIKFSINASAEQVWTVLSDFGGMAKWSPGLAMSAQLARQGIAVGAVRQLTFVKPVAGIQTVRERIVQCGDKWFSYILDDGFGPYRNAGGKWTVTANGDGGCTVEVVSSWSAGPWWAIAAWPAAYFQLKRGITRAVPGLEELAKKS
jgi:hypothetical protein